MMIPLGVLIACVSSRENNLGTPSTQIPHSKYDLILCVIAVDISNRTKYNLVTFLYLIQTATFSKTPRCRPANQTPRGNFAASP